MTGTAMELLKQAIAELEKLTPDEREKDKAQIYEALTGEPYVPAPPKSPGIDA